MINDFKHIFPLLPLFFIKKIERLYKILDIDINLDNINFLFRGYSLSDMFDDALIKETLSRYFIPQQSCLDDEDIKFKKNICFNCTPQNSVSDNDFSFWYNNGTEIVKVNI
jgi:hypothetical protein